MDCTKIPPLLQGYYDLRNITTDAYWTVNWNGQLELPATGTDRDADPTTHPYEARNWVLDPWATAPPTAGLFEVQVLDEDKKEVCTLLNTMDDKVVDGVWGMMPECGKPVTPGLKCYQKVTTNGLNGPIHQYIVYDEYVSCMHHDWLLLPGFPLIDNKFLIVVYLGFLIYLFLGVAIISDVFMAAIEVITSKTKVVRRKNKSGEEEEMTVIVWNATVANLTLMALGSSAPEILLAIIGTIVGLLNDEAPSELGAGTIVGSAAFNLLFISAVCMVVVPDGEKRAIEQVPVFLCTSFFSIWAYVWLLIVLSIWTPNEVTPAEAWITLLMFPLLVVISYAADIGYFGSIGAKPKDDEESAGDAAGYYQHVAALSAGEMHADRKQIAQLMRQLEAEQDATKSTKISEAMNFMMSAVPAPEMSRMKFRMNAVRGLFGRKHQVAGHKKTEPDNKVAPEGERAPKKLTAKQSLLKKMKNSTVPVFAFEAAAYSVLEKQGKISVVVLRGGPLEETVSVDYETEDGTATVEDNDYTPVKGTMTFAPAQDKATIEVLITDDDTYEPDENFFVKLSNPSAGGEVLTASVEVTIIDDDEPGIISFDQAMVEVLETATSVTVLVKRAKGCDGRVTVDFKTVDMTAVKGEQYVETAGTLVFENNATQQSITVPFVPGGDLEVHQSFGILLENGTGGVQVSKRNRCVVTFTSDDEVTEMAEKLLEKMQHRNDVFAFSGGSWSQQFREAIFPEGGVDEDGEDVEPDAITLVMHYLCITWKLIFALLPPVDYYGGWATFFCALAMIGGVTLLVGEVAALLGCAMTISPGITAITFVALGTSLPDTFASKQATVESPNADAAIGNVTGSNSVNVFLGLGLPWVLATLWKGNKPYYMPAGSLAFSVIVFGIVAVIALFVLFVRRMMEGAELGGNTTGKKATAVFFVCLWLVYILMSAINESSPFLEL